MFSVAGTSVTTGDVHPTRLPLATSEVHSDLARGVWLVTQPGPPVAGQGCSGEADHRDCTFRGRLQPGETRDIEFAGLRHATDTGTAWLRSKWEQFLTNGCS